MEVIAGHREESPLDSSHRHLPMQSQIALMFLAIMLLFGIFSALLNSWITTNNFEKDLNEKAGRYLQVVFNEYVNHQNQPRVDVLQNQLSDIVKDKDILKVGLYNSSAEAVVFKGANTDVPNEIFDSENSNILTPIIINNSRYYKLSFPQGFNSNKNLAPDVTKLDSVVLSINDDLVFQVAQKAFVWTFLLVMLTAGFAMMLAVVAIRKFTEPFDRLLNAMRNAQLGQRGVRVRPGGASEVFQMATSFNAMIAVLERREERLLEQKGDLEKQITVREQTELELKDLTYRLQAIFDNVTDGILVVDKDYKIVSMNTSANEISGYQGDELVGEELSLILNSAFLKVSMASLKAKGSEGKLVDNETVVTQKTEHQVPVEVGIILMEFSGQRHYLITLRDITERKKADTKLNDYRLHLESMVIDQTKDIAQSRDAARAGEKAMSAFLANMSHELRTPMHGVLSFANIALRKIDSASIDKTKEYLNEIKVSGNNLLDIINDLLDLSKMKSGKMEYQYSSVLFSNIAKNVERQMMLMAQKENVSLDIEVFGEEINFDMDEMRMTQVVRNLYANAIKFADKSTDVKVGIDYRTNNNLIFSVFNYGVCVPEDEGEIIFQSFSQSSNTKNNAGGTGLGLPICKEIIESGHDGKIYVDMDVENGAKFIVEIPLATRLYDNESTIKEVHHS